MKEIEFSWDSAKNRENQRKHGVGFQEAATAFEDENGRLKHDPDHSEQEDRFILLGISSNLRLLVVSHTYRRDDRTIRIITARKATQSERKQYVEFL
jgi:hypothetical protein